MQEKISATARIMQAGMSCMASRGELISRLANLRNATILTYVTSDRGGGPPVFMAEDAIRPMFDHLRGRDDTSRPIDLFIYSRGGDVEVPWRIVSMIREFCTRFNVIVPYHAHSAATLVALGANEIVMGAKAELGPIDPSLARSGRGGRAEEISAEDVMSYLRFLRDGVGLSDQSSLTSLVASLADGVQPLTLGTVFALHSHVRMVAEKMLRLHMRNEQAIQGIVSALVERMHLHGHAIGRKEAKSLGLKISIPTPEVEKAIWELFESYEEALKLRESFDPDAKLEQEGKDDLQVPMILACVESEAGSTRLEGTAAIRRLHEVPENLTINISAAVPQEVLNAVSEETTKLLQSILEEVAQMAKQEVVSQLPVKDIEVEMKGVHWTTLSEGFESS